MRVALVHDWLTGMRGGEWVLREIADMFPEASIYTLVHRRGSVMADLERHPIHTSWLQVPSFGGRRWRYLLPLMPAAVENFDFPDVDLVISSSHCVAKGVIPPPGAFHLSYVHTPMRYVWDQRSLYLNRIPRPLLPIAQGRLSRLREWDMVSSTRVDRLIANSRLVAWRIKHYWNRSAEVIPPPVDTEFFTPGGQRGELREAYRSAAAVLVPNIEDFGMASVEALACGTPVVGIAASGTADVVRDGIEGRLAGENSVDALVEATAGALDRAWDPLELRQRTEGFSRTAFQLRFRYLLDRLELGGGRG